MMAIYSSIYCAMPKLSFPPSKNLHIPTPNHIKQVIAPLYTQWKSVLNLAAVLTEQAVLSPELEHATKPIDRPEFNDLKELFLTLNRIHDTAQFFSNPGTQHRQFITKELQSALLFRGNLTHFNLDKHYPWLPSFINSVNDHDIESADRIICQALWQACELAITTHDTQHQKVGLLHIICRYIQWHLCQTRQQNQLERRTETITRFLQSIPHTQLESAGANSGTHH